MELSGMDHVEQVRRFALGGCRLVQVRDKKLSGKELFKVVSSAVAIAHGFGMKVIVNDRVDIAMAAGAAGVHLGQGDLPPEHARLLLGSEAMIGYSTHSIEQAIEAAKLPVDYIAIGPIFATHTKQDPDPVVGLDGLRGVRAAIGQFPLVAIGGINERNLRAVLTAGADSVALVSELYKDSANMTAQFTKLSNLADNV